MTRPKLARILETPNTIAVAATGIFAILILTANVTHWHQADDFIWLVRARDPNTLAFWSLPTFSRFPTGTLVAELATRIRFWEFFDRGLGLIVLFAIHAHAIALLVRHWKKDHQRLNLAQGLLILGVILSPNNYQVTLWPYMSLHCLGEWLIAWCITRRTTGATLQSLRGLLSPKNLILAFATLVALFMYDGLLFWWLGLECYEAILLPTKQRQASAIRAAAILFVWAGIKFTSSALTHSPALISASYDPLVWLARAKDIPLLVWGTHFYKTQWLASLLKFSFLGTWFFALATKKRKPAQWLALILPGLLALPLCLVPYDAPRVFWGPILLAGLALCVDSLLQNYPAKRATIVLASLMLVLTLSQWQHILNYKRENDAVLTAYDTTLVHVFAAQMNGTQPPQSVCIEHPSLHLKRDWVLPEFAEPLYIQYWQQRHLAHPRPWAWADRHACNHTSKH